MSGTNEAETSNSSLTQIMNSAITSHTQSTRDSIKMRLQMSQSQTLNIGSVVMTDGCTLSANQSMSAELSSTIQTLHNMSSDTITNIAVTAQQAIFSRLSQKNEDLNFGQTNATKNSTSVRSDIENAIRNAQEQMSETYGDIGAIMNQEQVINMENLTCSGVGTALNFSQEMAIQMFAETVAGNLFSATSENNSTAEAIQTTTTVIEQHNKGLDIFAMCVASSIALVLLALIAGFTSTKMYEDTPDEAKIAVAEAASTGIKAKTGKRGGRVKTRSIDKLIKYGGFGMLESAAGGNIIGIITYCCVFWCFLSFWKNSIRPCWREDSKVFDEQPMGDDYEEPPDESECII